MPREDLQAPLFDTGESWDEHWQGMPEFSHEDQTPLRTLMIHFEKQSDIDAFARLIGQKVTPLTKSMWFPEAEIGRISDRRYIDAAALPDLHNL